MSKDLEHSLNLLLRTEISHSNSDAQIKWQTVHTCPYIVSDYMQIHAVLTDAANLHNTMWLLELAIADLV